MKKIILLITIFFGFFAFGQKKIKDTLKYDVERIAEYPKGFDEFRKQLSQNFRLDRVSGSGKIHCELKFVVDKEGNIVNITAEGNNNDFNSEAIQSISQIKEKWIPATLNGFPIRYKFRVPLDIDLGDIGNPYPNYFLGNDTFKKFIISNIRTKKFKNSIQEQCSITFIIQSNGEISQIDATGANEIFNKEVIRAVSKIKGRWIPAYRYGKPISEKLTIPLVINFEELSKKL